MMLSLTRWNAGHKQMHSHVLTWKGQRQTLFTTCLRSKFSPVSWKFNSIELPLEIRFLLAFTIHIAKATEIAPGAPLQMFNVMTLRRTMVSTATSLCLRRQGWQAAAVATEMATLAKTIAA
jgi:hypothetical protein